MSWVATMLLVVHWEDADHVNDLSHWLEHDAPWNGPSVPPSATGVGFLKRLDEADVWGGWKRPEGKIWGVALNHADLTAVVDAVAAAPWDHPGAVQLFLKDQEQDYFRLWMIRDGEAVQYAPDPPGDDDMVE